MNSPVLLKAQISQFYSEQIRGQVGCCQSGERCDDSYPIGVLEHAPAGVVSFGCGNPTALARLCRGETVLDLGSGAGLDCFLAAQQVGSAGSVIGIDFTQAMIDQASENAVQLGLANVSFRLGDIEALPLDDEMVDVIISNCVINLAPNKETVFREAFRVLRSGGRLMVSDIVLTRPVTEEEMANLAIRAGCISGSLPVDHYIETVRMAGFQNVRMDTEQEAREREFWFSAAISGDKPL